jgi:hypothetical protein
MTGLSTPIRLVAEVLSDGVLIDVSQTARGAGICYPVALAAAAWAKGVVVSPGVFSSSAPFPDPRHLPGSAGPGPL